MITQARHPEEGMFPAHALCSPLKYQRLLRGWSQQDVVEAIYQQCVESGHPDVGINTDQVGRWENGKCKPSPIYRKQLCALYGLTAAQLGLLNGLEVQA